MSVRNYVSELAESNVTDFEGNKLGTVAQVYVTSADRSPSWVAVKSGLLGVLGFKEYFIPLTEARFESGTILVPYCKELVKGAPAVDEGTVISPEQEDELYRYYGIKDNAEPTGPATPKPHLHNILGTRGHGHARDEKACDSDPDLASTA
ncbi:MAG TPA: PRC-barrel domain-containing protein [Dietzia timorensis]|uniref:PRC-barrel domain-containing protein n=1 Tax=Dietzia timorensis TaxID=499555 RepID=A0A921F5N2_9ACTN|nr:PRC-barrel domain-containing protein [Dietzia timorensis]HJE92065.1 PRC-barrel domain-containing protein [Dietzia timorensis]